MCVKAAIIKCNGCKVVSNPGMFAVAKLVMFVDSTNNNEIVYECGSANNNEECGAHSCTETINV